MRTRVLLSTLIVASVGSALHFAWEWSGRSTVVAVFAATSESTWEHLKLAFWPALLLAPVQRALYGPMPGFLPGTGVRVLLPPLLIVALFYGYTAVLGTNLLPADIATFVIAVLAGETAGHALMRRSLPGFARGLAFAAILVGVAAFACLTFIRPPGFLFRDPVAHRSASAAAGCVADANAPALDHVVIAVRDLDAAAAAFAAHGFRIKAGRLHANNLLNRHIKFRDGSEIELMTVSGPPLDPMAQDYADLIAAGDGGVYVALRAEDLAPVERAAAAAGLDVTHSRSGPWRFISFPAGSPAAAIFFGSGTASVQDPDSLLSHALDADGLDEAWLEAGDIAPFLHGIGAARCGSVTIDGRVGVRWALARGSLVIFPARADSRPRVTGVRLRSAAAAPSFAPLPGFVVRLIP